MIIILVGLVVTKKIIDSILDRRDGRHYSPHDFYIEVKKYERLGVGTHGDDISIAMDYGDNRDVQRVLCQYIDRNKYNSSIKDYIRSQEWVP